MRSLVGTTYFGFYTCEPQTAVALCQERNGHTCLNVLTDENLYKMC